MRIIIQPVIPAGTLLFTSGVGPRAQIFASTTCEKELVRAQNSSF